MNFRHYIWRFLLLSIDTIVPEDINRAVPGPIKRTALPFFIMLQSYLLRWIKKAMGFNLLFVMSLVSKVIWIELTGGIPDRVQTSYSVFNKTFLLSQLENWIDHMKGGLYSSVYMCLTPNRGPGRRREKLKWCTYCLGREFQTLTREYSPFL